MRSYKSQKRQPNDNTPEKPLDRCPSKVTAQISEAVKELSPEAPVYIDTSAQPWSLIARCYLNCERFVEFFGGTIVYGYLIWELPDTWLTAVHHAVVELDGRLIDPTPDVGGSNRVLFLPDRAYVPHGPPPPERFLMLTDRPSVQRAAKLLRRNDAIGQHYARITGYEYFLERIRPRHAEFNRNWHEYVRIIEAHQKYVRGKRQRTRQKTRR